MVGLISRFISSALHGRYLTLVAMLLVLIAGIFAFKVLPLEAYPELANPQVRVITLVPGRGAEEVERLVTVPLEKHINGVPGQLALRSLSLYGLSVVTVTFSDGTPTALARQQVHERIREASLPEGVTSTLEPDVGSLREIYRYALHSPYYSPMGLRSIQTWEMEKLLKQVPGVIGVVSQGGQTKTYQVNVDPARLNSYKIKLEQVYEAIRNANATTGGGFIVRNGNALIVRELGMLGGIQDVGDVVLVTSEKGGTPVRVRDVASIEIGPMVRRGQVGRDQEDDIVEGIVLLRRGENPSQVLTNLYEHLPAIIGRLPSGVRFDMLYDRSDLVNRTLATVGTNVAFGIGLVLILLSIFLAHLGWALITALVIPLAILVAFICLNLFGVPANLLSLGAIDFGILVDSAVVMTENIMRRLSEEGQDLRPAERLHLLKESACEVGSPIVFGIAVIIATFLPIFTFSGVEGKLFRPLATTMVTALVGAGVASLAVVPVLCSLFFVKRAHKDTESVPVAISRRLYDPSLRLSLKQPKIVIAVAAVAFGGSIVVFCNLGSEFLPHLEEGNIWLRATIKPGSVSLDESIRVARDVRQTLLKYPEVTQVLSQAGGPDDGTDPARFADQEYFVDLQPARQWRAQFNGKKERLIAAMRQDLQEIPGVDYYFTQYIQTTLDEALSGVQGSLVAKVSGPDLEVLQDLGRRVGAIMSRTSGIVDVIVDPLLGQPQVVIEFDREAAARYNLNVEDLRQLVETAVAGKSATKLIEGERRFDVVVRLAEPYRSTEKALKNLLIDTPSGMKIPIAQIAEIREFNGATQIWREAGSRLATIRANVRGRDLANAVADAQKVVAAEVKLPRGYHVVWSGEFQRQKEASRQLAVVLPVTLVVIITILYLACGTLSGALVMFSVVPLAAIGAVLGLHLTGTYFSISAGVGFIALFGLAVKNGILLVSFVNDLRQQGRPLNEAVYQGALTRMRPVIMTATIAAFGLLPAALSTEIGSQTQRPFAIVIIGGLISCTALSLYVLPALYLCFSPRPGRSKRHQGAHGSSAIGGGNSSL